MQNDLPLSPKDAARVKHLLRLPKPGILCGDPEPHMAGLFVPTQPELWGGKPGKRRLLVYALCRRCGALPDRANHVAARIMRDLGGRGN